VLLLLLPQCVSSISPSARSPAERSLCRVRLPGSPAPHLLSSSRTPMARVLLSLASLFPPPSALASSLCPLARRPIHGVPSRAPVHLLARELPCFRDYRSSRCAQVRDDVVESPSRAVAAPARSFSARARSCRAPCTRAPSRLRSDRALAAGARRPRLSYSLLRSPWSPLSSLPVSARHRPARPSYPWLRTVFLSMMCRCQCCRARLAPCGAVRRSRMLKFLVARLFISRA
jgi:hypothetical protein